MAVLTLAVPEPRAIAGLRQIANDFDAILVDQFGVMHDGVRPFDGAVDALQHLTSLGKAVIVLTNSGNRAARNTERVVTVGFPKPSFTAVISSGEVAWAGIRTGTFGPAFRPGARAGLVGKHGANYSLDDLGLTFVTDFGLADIVLIMGSDCPRTSLDAYRAALAPAAARHVPALCCNPDIKMLTSQGLQPSAGAIAQIYRELGGPVEFVGKPHGAIYREAVRVTGANPARTLAIGDSLDHDIVGGANAGFRTALVRTGILAEMDESAFAAALSEAQCKPDYLLPRLCW